LADYKKAVRDYVEKTTVVEANGTRTYTPKRPVPAVKVREKRTPLSSPIVL
jgi:hypothetical protein